MTHSFPKIIWQTHNYKKEWLPEHLRASASAWINLNPGWDYRYVNQVERDETVRKYPEIYEVYKYEPPVLQTDIWRLIAVYEEGGCYADMDSLPIMPLDCMIEKIGGNLEVITVTENGTLGGNYHNFIGKKNSPILKDVFDTLYDWIDADRPIDEIQPIRSFVKIVYSPENNDRVSQKFEVAHSDEFKKSFDITKHQIDYCGIEMGYGDYVKEHNLELIYNF